LVRILTESPKIWNDALVLSKIDVKSFDSNNRRVYNLSVETCDESLLDFGIRKGNHLYIKEAIPLPIMKDTVLASILDLYIMIKIKNLLD